MEDLQKNMRLRGEVTGLTSQGAGVCRAAGRAVFLPGAIPGEVWEYQIVKVTATAVWAKGLALLSPSPRRREPDCPLFGRCGGCQLRHMDYELELEWKLRRVNDALERIGGLSLRAGEILGAEAQECYRNKCIYAVGPGPVTGFYRARSHEILPVERCLLQPEAADRAAAALRRWMAETGCPAYDEARRTGCVRHLFFRAGFRTGQTQLTVVARTPPHKKAPELLAAFRAAVPELTSFVWNENPSRGNTVLSGAFHTLWGPASIEDELCSLRFSLSPQAFYQIHPAQAEKLYRRALDYAGEAETALDLYCGAGTITLCLAGRIPKVYGAEIVPEAVENARANARRNGIGNARFLCGDAPQAARELAGRGVRPDVIVVDPPRKGLSPETPEVLASMAPKRIVYVSCDPGTLARDLRRLAALGYVPAAATAVDMFPRTSHVETVVLLSKGEVDSKKIRVEFSLEDMDMSEFQDGATYPQIKEYVLENTGLKVSNLYISQIKRKCGIEVGKNYNLPKSEDSRQPQCPPEKEKAIREAFKYFGMI